MPSRGGEEEHPHWHRSHRIGSLHAKWVIVPLRPGGDIIGEWCVRQWCQRRRNRGRRRRSLQHANLIIDWWWWSLSSYGRGRAPLPAPGPAFKHTTINTHAMGQDNVIKTRRSHHYYCLFVGLRHDESSTHRAWSLPVGMVVPPMQSIRGRRLWHICVAYGPPHGRYARFAMSTMFGASATDCGWLLFVVVNLGVRCCHNTSQAFPRLF